MLSGISVVSVLLVFAIATFPGEWLEAQLAWFPLRQVLVAGEVDDVARKPTSLWSNRLVLPGLDVIDHTKFDTEAKVATAPTTASLRGRDLVGAVLIGAVLRRVDFDGANFHGASLDEAELQGATFVGAQLQRVPLFAAKLQGARLSDAQLQGANLASAELQGAWLGGARLQGANLSFVRLQGASLGGAQLQGASLVAAQLLGADLGGASLQGASLTGAHLQGAELNDAKLQGADLDSVELQGASLFSARLQEASLQHVFVWRANVNDADAQGARIEAAETNPKQSCEDRLVCDWADTLDSLKRSFQQYVPESGRRTETLAQLERRLDPKRALDGEDEMARRWVELQDASPHPDIYEEKLADLWRGIGCSSDGAPFVLTGLVFTMSIPSSSPFTSDSMQVPRLAADFLKQDCVGARGISEDTRATLIKLRDAVPKASAKPNTQPADRL